MGRQYGALLKTEMHKIYPQIIDYYTQKGTATYKLLLEAAKKDYKDYPEEYKKFIEAMAETSGLTMEQHQILCRLEFFDEFSPPETPVSNKCTCIAVSKELTADEKQIFGRNYDWITDKKLTKYLTTTIFHFDNGNTTASINYPGEIYGMTVMNDKGLFMALNDGHASGKINITKERGHLFTKLLSFLRDANNFEDFQKIAQAEKFDQLILLNIADGKNSRSYEFSTDTVKFIQDFKVAANLFLHPDWQLGKPNIELSCESAERRTNVLKILDQPNAKIDLETMKDILNKPIKDGGVSLEQQYSQYRVIAKPEELKFWISAPEVFDWTEINLKPFFEK
jgi:hypothetical protein